MIYGFVFSTKKSYITFSFIQYNRFEKRFLCSKFNLLYCNQYLFNFTKDKASNEIVCLISMSVLIEKYHHIPQ